MNKNTPTIKLGNPKEERICEKPNKITIKRYQDRLQIG
jgi:hypothetical protein